MVVHFQFHSHLFRIHRIVMETMVWYQRLKAILHLTMLMDVSESVSAPPQLPVHNELRCAVHPLLKTHPAVRLSMTDHRQRSDVPRTVFFSFWLFFFHYLLFFFLYIAFFCLITLIHWYCLILFCLGSISQFTCIFYNSLQLDVTPITFVFNLFC